MYDICLQGRKGVRIYDLLNLECMIDGPADEVVRSEGLKEVVPLWCYFQVRSPPSCFPPPFTFVVNPS